jgi:hypothetical protein
MLRCKSAVTSAGLPNIGARSSVAMTQTTAVPPGRSTRRNSVNPAWGLRRTEGPVGLPLYRSARLDRLARWMRQLLCTIDDLQARGIGLRSLHKNMWLRRAYASGADSQPCRGRVAGRPPALPVHTCRPPDIRVSLAGT